MGLGVARLQFQGPAVAGDRFVELSLVPEGIAQVVMEGSLGPLQPDRPCNVLDGNLVLAHLAGDDSKQMQCIGMIRLDRQDPPIDLLGQVQPAGLVVLKGNLKCF